MTRRPHRANDGKYHINGKAYKELFGSRVQVHNGTAYKTEGNLTKSQLFMNKWGRIVSALKHKTAKKENRLKKYGYGAKKGKFGYVKIGATKKASKGKSRKMRGGANPDPDPNADPNAAADADDHHEEEKDPDAVPAVPADAVPAAAVPAAAVPAAAVPAAAVPAAAAATPQ